MKDKGHQPATIFRHVFSIPACSLITLVLVAFEQTSNRQIRHPIPISYKLMYFVRSSELETNDESLDAKYYMILVVTPA